MNTEVLYREHVQLTVILSWTSLCHVSYGSGIEYLLKVLLIDLKFNFRVIFVIVCNLLLCWYWYDIFCWWHIVDIDIDCLVNPPTISTLPSSHKVQGSWLKFNISPYLFYCSEITQKLLWQIYIYIYKPILGISVAYLI